MGESLRKMKKVSIDHNFHIPHFLSLCNLHRLDELLKRNCEVAAAKGTSVDAVRIANANSHTNSTQSSHSPSVAGDSLDVKVEITPAPPTPMSDIQNSFSIESTSSLTICSDVSSKSQATSPNTRKLSELPPMESGGFLNPIANFNRLNPSPPNTASARLFKKLEEMIDLSLPYNHYRCLSPSETNLSNPADKAAQAISPNSKQLDSGKPGSSRLLRRQFSLDKDDINQKHANLETISSLIESSRQQNFTLKSQYQPLISSSSLPASSATAALIQSGKLHKHQSASVAQDLEKIEEINIDTPLSPNNSTMSIATNNSFKRSAHSNSFRHTTSTTPHTFNNDRKEFKFH